MNTTRSFSILINIAKTFTLIFEADALSRHGFHFTFFRYLDIIFYTTECPAFNASLRWEEKKKSGNQRPNEYSVVEQEERNFVSKVPE